MPAQKPAVSNGILDSTGRLEPLALVAVWGSESLTVVCPYCREWHDHCRDKPPQSRETLPAECRPSPEGYQPCYPFDEPAQAQYSYRIDRDSNLFVTVGIALSEIEEANRDLRSPQALEDKVEQLSITDTETPEPHSSDVRHRRSLFARHCILNELDEVKSLLETYKDDSFTSWRDEKGVNCIALAAVEGHDEMIRFLHDKGGDLDNTDNLGRTPLMEAALWGRLKVVNYLLDHGANPCAKDRKGHGTYYYSRPLGTTAIMRRKRMQEKFPGYQESGEAEPNRRIIARKLKVFKLNTGAGKFVEHTTEQGPRIVYCKKTQTTFYKVPSEKTVARLDRGSLFPAMSAVSGWRICFPGEHMLDSRLWLEPVLELCRMIGYALPEYDLDDSTVPGSYYASHAEKKLVAYYIKEHVILPSKLFEGFAVDQQEDWMKQDLELQDLATLCPKISTVPARIQVSRDICSDCKLFIKHVKKKLGVSLTAEYCEVVRSRGTADEKPTAVEGARPRVRSIKILSAESLSIPNWSRQGEEK